MSCVSCEVLPGHAREGEDWRQKECVTGPGDHAKRKDCCDPGGDSATPAHHGSSHRVKTSRPAMQGYISLTPHLKAADLSSGLAWEHE